jgi:hypothetical protein
MSKYDLSYESSIGEGSLYKGGVQRTLPKKEEISSPWLEMIVDLVIGAGYSYSRIAYRLNVSPSTIQKLATHPDRRPRFKLFDALLKLHHKVFCGQYASPMARAYLTQKINLISSNSNF